MYERGQWFSLKKNRETLQHMLVFQITCHASMKALQAQSFHLQFVMCKHCNNGNRALKIIYSNLGIFLRIQNKVMGRTEMF